MLAITCAEIPFFSSNPQGITLLSGCGRPDLHLGLRGEQFSPILRLAAYLNARKLSVSCVNQHFARTDNTRERPFWPGKSRKPIPIFTVEDASENRYPQSGKCSSIAIMRCRCQPNAEQGRRAKSVRILWTTLIQSDELKMEIA